MSGMIATYRPTHALMWIALCSAVPSCADRAAEQPLQHRSAAEDAVDATPGASVIIFLVDTLRADILGPHGGDARTSERFATLAHDGVLYEDCVAPAPWTLPSVASLFTGTLPRTHGAGLQSEARFLGGPEQPEPLAVAREIPTLARVLGEHGYATYLRGTNPFVRFGLEADFDTAELSYTHAGEVVDWGLATLAKQPLDKPYLLVLHFLDLHEPNRIGTEFGREELDLFFPPLLPPIEESERRWPPPSMEPYRWQHTLAQRKRIYLASQRYVDQQIGRCLDAIEASRPGEARFVVYTSDHGEDFFENFEVDLASGHMDPRAGYRAPLSYGHGHNLHRSLTHVPLVLAGPGLHRGQRIAETVGLIDVLPTLCRLLDIAVPGTVQGRSLPMGRAERTPAYLSESIAYGRERVAFTTPDGWKLIQPLAIEEREQLFYLPDDRGERVNLADRDPEQVRLMRAQLLQYVKTLPRGTGQALGADASIEEALRALGYLGAKKPEKH